MLPEYRQRGIGTRLMDAAEELAFSRSPAVGIGVGMYADYGAAQRMYVRRGYVPDGRGLTYNNRVVEPGETVCVDDDLVLHFTKRKPRRADQIRLAEECAKLNPVAEQAIANEGMASASGE